MIRFLVFAVKIFDFLCQPIRLNHAYPQNFSGAWDFFIITQKQPNNNKR